MVPTFQSLKKSISSLAPLLTYQTTILPLECVNGNEPIATWKNVFGEPYTKVELVAIQVPDHVANRLLLDQLSLRLLFL